MSRTTRSKPHWFKTFDENFGGMGNNFLPTDERKLRRLDSKIGRDGAVQGTLGHPATNGKNGFDKQHGEVWGLGLKRSAKKRTARINRLAGKVDVVADCYAE